MRRPLIAGNWKMNLDRGRAVALVGEVVAGAKKFGQVDVVLCPPFVYLDAVARQDSPAAAWRWVPRTCRPGQRRFHRRDQRRDAVGRRLPLRDSRAQRAAPIARRDRRGGQSQNQGGPGRRLDPDRLRRRAAWPSAKRARPPR